ncbi:YjfB family protein [Bacillus infantis]|uniref:YjfB family protein n=1 Tax=Bacillus infantis TaxID=324767 RepID=UPI003CEA457D
MDIALMSMVLRQGKVQQEGSLSVMKMAMGKAEQQGEALQELLNTNDVTVIQRAPQPHLGGNIDLKA